MRLLIIIGMLLLAGFAALVSAQEERNEEPNWCYAGQPWGDGRCNDPDADIADYNWRLGWVMAHCERGELPASECGSDGRSRVVPGGNNPTGNPASDSAIVFVDSGAISGGGFFCNGTGCEALGGSIILGD